MLLFLIGLAEKLDVKASCCFLFGDPEKAFDWTSSEIMFCFEAKW